MSGTERERSVCLFSDCRLGYLNLSEEQRKKKHKHHIRLYHDDVKFTVFVKVDDKDDGRVVGASFVFRRDPSFDKKYRCLCASTFANPYNLKVHIGGDERTHKDCSATRVLAQEIVIHRIARDTPTISYHYSEMSAKEVDVQDEFEEEVEVESWEAMEVDENSEPHARDVATPDEKPKPRRSTRTSYRILVK